MTRDSRTTAELEYTAMLPRKALIAYIERCDSDAKKYIEATNAFRQAAADYARVMRQMTKDPDAMNPMMLDIAKQCGQVGEQVADMLKGQCDSMRNAVSKISEIRGQI